MSKGIDIADLRDRINKLVEKASLSAYELGVYCAEVDPKIKTKADEEEFFPGLTLDETMFSRYVKIGQNKFIRKYLASLPLAFSTLYHVACLTEEEVKVGIAEGVINPSATRVAVQNWISLRKGKGQVSNDNQIIFRVVRPNDFTTEEEEKLNTELREVLQRNRCRFSGNEAQALAATLKARGDYLRSNTRAQITAEKLRREKEQRLKPRAQRTKAWPYPHEQVKVASDANAEDCQRVLELIGCTDEWQKILDDAARLYGVVTEVEPTPPKKASPRKKAA